MIKIFQEINKKFNSIIWSLLSTGIILVMLSILIVWTDFMLRLVIGVLVLVIAYTFIYGAYKLWTLKVEIDKFIKRLG